MKFLRKLKELWVLYVLLGPNQRKWLLFLKNNPEKQGKNSLGVKLATGDYKACCLGQAGLMFGYCHFDSEGILRSTDNRVFFPESEDNEKYLKLIGQQGEHSILGTGPDSLAGINDNKTWLDVYNTCIDNPRKYFTGKI